jgi:single-stranded-DNA-specific exonuclease
MARIAEVQAWFGEALGPEVRAVLNAGRTISIDAALNARGATLDLIDLLDRAGPYGAGHPEPVLAFPGHRVAYAEAVGGGHVRVSLAAGDGATVKAMAFRAAGTPLGDVLLARDGRALHVAATLAADHWRGESRPALRILDIGLAD